MQNIISHVSSIVTTESEETSVATSPKVLSLNTSRNFLASGLNAQGSPAVKVENQQQPESGHKSKPFRMKKPKGCPADGIEGFRLFMIGQKDKPVNLIPEDVKRRLTVHHLKSKGSNFDPKQ